MKQKNDLRLIREGLKYVPELLGKHYILLNSIRYALLFMTPYVSIYLSGRIITALAEERPFREIVVYALIAVFSTLILESIYILFTRSMRRRERLGRPKHDALLSKKALSLDYGKAESSSVSELRAKVQENSRGGRGGIIWMAEHFSQLISYVLSVIVAVIMIRGIFFSHSTRVLTGTLRFFDSDLAMILLCTVSALLILVSVLSENKSVRHGFTRFSSRGKLHATMDHYSEKVLNENTSGKDIRIFHEANLIREELVNRVFIPFRKSENSIFRIQSTFGLARSIVVAVIGGLVYIFVGIKSLAGAFGVGKVVEYYGMITKLIESISNIAHEIGLIKSNNAYLELELSYLSLEPDLQNGSKSLDAIDKETAEIEFHHVSFRYPETKALVLDDVSFKIRIGEQLAVVGMNGSSKSTMIKLLCRLYDPTDGYITLGGVDIREFDLAEYLKFFSVVFQDFKLLAFSVAENVGAGDDYDAEKVLQCLEIAGIRERVERMPKGILQPIYTLYERDGIDLSGGEEQKIAIARALYKQAPFVILDEPTAALDPLAESDIYERFHTMVTDKTAVFISHRLSSCRFCDRILVFDKGKICEEGTHETLTAANGKYNEMWSAQAQYYN